MHGENLVKAMAAVFRLEWLKAESRSENKWLLVSVYIFGVKEEPYLC